jgi:hypothetical protein
VGDGLGFDTAAADRAVVEAGRGDEHLAAGVAGRAADGFDEGNAGEGRAAGGELGEAFDETVGRGH